MGKRAPKRDNRREAERLCAQLDVDLVVLATYVRRHERRGLDLRPVPDDALADLQRVAELAAAARDVVDDSPDNPRLDRSAFATRATVLGSPMRLD